MTENAETPHKKTKKSITIWVLSTMSFAYIGIVYFLIRETQTCNNVAISANWFKGFWDQYLGCRSVNELGDTLAGAFAPVAFLWLMGAVFIQSQELKAQREELDETQEVMRAQLQVSLQQVEETKASTELFKKQTEILEKEQRLREQKEADSDFDQRLSALIKSIRRENMRCRIQFKRKTPAEQTGVLLISDVDQLPPLPTRQELTPDTIRSALTQHFYDMKHEIASRGETHHLTNWVNIDGFRDIIAQLDAIIAMSDDLSVSYRTYYETFGFDQIQHGMNELLELAGDKGKWHQV